MRLAGPSRNYQYEPHRAALYTTQLVCSYYHTTYEEPEKAAAEPRVATRATAENFIFFLFGHNPKK
jgi:hypothetical protein